MNNGKRKEDVFLMSLFAHIKAGSEEEAIDIAKKIEKIVKSNKELMKHIEEFYAIDDEEMIFRESEENPDLSYIM